MDDLEKNVLLLAIYKKEEDEGLLDIVKKLENGRVFTLKEGKKLLKELIDEKMIISEKLSFVGEMKAKQIEQEFKL